MLPRARELKEAIGKLPGILKAYFLSTCRAALELRRKIPIPGWGLVVSCLAFLVAAGGLFLSKQKEEREKDAWEKSRRLIWVAEFEVDQTMVLSPANPEIRLLEAQVYFPHAKQPWGYDLKELRYRLSLEEVTALALGMARREFFVSPIYPHPFTQVLGGPSKIPILIATSYTSKGEIFFDRSVYLLGYSVDFTVKPTEMGEMKVKFDSLRLWQIIKVELDPYKHVQGIWSRSTREFVEQSEQAQQGTGARLPKKSIDPLKRVDEPPTR